MYFDSYDLSMCKNEHTFKSSDVKHSDTQFY